MADHSGRHLGWPGNDGPEDLASLRRTNRMLDAIAEDLPVATSDSDEYAVAMMLAAWREDIGRAPMPSKPTLAQARRALRGSDRSRLLATTIGSAAAAALLFGGFGAAVYQSHPGDALYGLRTSLFGPAKQVRTDPVVLSAQTELTEVEKLISQGDWDAAQQRLQVATAQVDQVKDAQQKAQLDNWVQRVEVKIDSKDPDATVPPGGVTPSPVTTTTPPTGSETSTSGETSETSEPSTTASSSVSDTTSSTPAETSTTTPTTETTTPATTNATPATSSSTAASSTVSSTTAPATTSPTPTSSTESSSTSTTTTVPLAPPAWMLPPTNFFAPAPTSSVS